MSIPDRVLALDIASGGVTACLMGPGLDAIETVEYPWTFSTPGDGTTTLGSAQAIDAILSAIRDATRSAPPPAAIVLSAMMHTLVITGADGIPRTPVYTWNDRRSGSYSRQFRDRAGDYRRRTGCHVHPSFPAFKLARLRAESGALLDGGARVLSFKAYVGWVLTGNRAEDTGTASASGLLNLETGDWDRTTFDALDLTPGQAAPVVGPETVIGHLRGGVATEVGLPEGIPVVAGSGDGFLAATGSGCLDNDDIALTLGTTPSARRFLDRPDPDAGVSTFCYRFRDDRYLWGLAGTSGGNALEWARETFPPSAPMDPRRPLPVFMPFQWGARSPFWDAARQAQWHETDSTTIGDLAASVVEGVVFQLCLFLDLLGETRQRIVLSGNGFLDPDLAMMLAGLTAGTIVEPDDPGMATLRGAVVCGFAALGQDVEPALRELIGSARRIVAEPVPARQERYRRFYDYCLPGPPGRGESNNRIWADDGARK